MPETEKEQFNRHPSLAEDFINSNTYICIRGECRYIIRQSTNLIFSVLTLIQRSRMPINFRIALVAACCGQCNNINFYYNQYYTSFCWI